MKLLGLMLCLAAVLAVGRAEIVTVTVTQKPLDFESMRSSAFMNQYCSKADSRISGEGYRSQFAPDLDQCLNRCNRDPVCSSVDFSADKTCNQHNSGGASGFESGWTHYQRQIKDQDCPSDTTQHVMVPSAYSGTFCLYADKKCPGNDLYRNGQNIADTTKCMEKCAKIKSCSSADFKDGKCYPKNYACSPDEMEEASGSTFMQRLAAGVEECVCPSGYTRDAEGVCQEDAPAVDGSWGTWTWIDTCSANCGEGSRTKRRTCNGPQNGGDPCVDTDGNEATVEIMTGTCNADPCPTWCKYLHWRMFDPIDTVFTTIAGPSTSLECRNHCWDDAACKGIIWKDRICYHYKGSSPVLDGLDPTVAGIDNSFNVFVKVSTLTLEADGSCPGTNPREIKVDS